MVSVPIPERAASMTSVLQARGGLMDLTGEERGEPQVRRRQHS